MNRSIALVGAICVIIGWLLASTLSPPVANVQSRPQTRAVPSASQEQAPVLPRVQWDARPAPQPPAGRRNPFLFASEETHVVTSERMIRADDPLPADTVEAEQPAGPSFSLAGIGINGDVRTAILTIGDTVRIVGMDDQIEGFTVVEIGDASITVAQGDTRYVLRFAQ